MKNKKIRLIAFAASTCVAMTTMNASALFTDNTEKVVSIESSETTKKKPPVLLTAGYLPNNQVVCLDRKPTGTRIKKRVCQTVAAWKVQLENDHVRQHFLIQR